MTNNELSVAARACPSLFVGSRAPPKRIIVIIINIVIFEGVKPRACARRDPEWRDDDAARLAQSGIINYERTSSLERFRMIFFCFVSAKLAAHP